MKLSDLATSSLQSLLRTKSRSLLTMFGIVIGIAAVILSLSIGDSAKLYILNQISSFGSDQLIINNGPREDTSMSFTPQETLTMKDLKRIQKEPWVKAASGELFQTDLMTVNGQSKNISIIGTLPEDYTIGDYHLEKGMFFTQDEVDSHARVVVLGHSLAENFFGQEEALGKSIKLGKVNYRVIGVMDKLGVKFFQNLDEMVYIPATSVMDAYHKDHFTYFVVQKQPTITMALAKTNVEDLLRDLHNIENPERIYSKDDFHVVSQEEAIQVVGQITGILGILLSAVAAISLLVGGIGIMNIMFVTVTERIREIGLRKAVGATHGDILGQFLSEAVVLTVLGGAAGVVFGTFLSWLTIQIISQYQQGWIFTISLSGIILGVVVSTMIGVFFGYIPARRAARLNPIDAMRAND